VRFACHGGCPKDRFVTDRHGERGLNYLCPSYTLFFEHVRPRMEQMAALLRNGRYADEIRRLVALEDAQRDAQAPCPCGGGAAWSTCHGAGASRGTPPTPGATRS
jgi:uncharacterized protein